MSKTVIKVEDVGKQYRLGEIGTGTISHDLNRWWAKLRGKEDPFAKIGEMNDRAKKGDTDYVWALKDINFEVKQGEVLGIIGRNGAGKSTLLKLLSQVTKPTTGKIKVQGRIASLLEVGTGFHPEMTGRENIFMNGAILGMTKAEIRKKFDDIVDFSGVERYIDTPVKRYSSGMYVRLAFSVAASLEPEILIIDEVLAVGDAEFQKKCLGRMKDVSVNEGRTVLFVSHNMAAVQNLCRKAVYLKNGFLEYEDDTAETVKFYLSDIKTNSNRKLTDITERKGSGRIRITEIIGYDSNDVVTNIFPSGEKIQLRVFFKAHTSLINISSRIDIGINNDHDVRVAWLSSSIFCDSLGENNEKLIFDIRSLPLVEGNYTVNLYCQIENEVADWLENVYSFQVVESDFYGTGKKVPLGQGLILLDYKIL